MTTLIVVSLLSYSVFWFLNYSELLRPLQKVLDTNKMLSKPVGWKVWVSKLYKCPYCLGFHIGWIMLSFEGYTLPDNFIFAFVVAILAYFLHIFEKSIIRNL